MNICSVESCGIKVRRNGFCSRHSQQMKKWGEIRRSKGDANEIIKYETYAEIILYDIDYNEKARAVIDLDDVSRCIGYKWTLRNDGYVSCKSNGVGIKLHRFIANTPKGMHTDHLDRNKLNNRKYNLRICTQSENNKNKNTYKNNKSGRRGVAVESNGKYYVAIRFNNKEEYIGSFDDLKEAVKARENAEIKYYGCILADK